MKAFGDHLRADKDICFMRPKLFENVFVAMFFRDGIAVHAKRANVWKKRMECLFDMFCPKSTELHRMIGPAMRTCPGYGLSVVTKMALQTVRLLVKGEREIAMAALNGALTARA